MGYDAEYRYNEHLEAAGTEEDDGNAEEKVHLYRHFKMLLHDSQVRYMVIYVHGVCFSKTIS